MVNLKEYIEKLIREDSLWKFYKSKDWTELKEKILKKNHRECQECKAKGIITKADTVHHIKHVRKYPELALSEYYLDERTGRQQRNLIPLCKACHNKAHPEKRKRNTGNANDTKFVNEERW